MARRKSASATSAVLSTPEPAGIGQQPASSAAIRKTSSSQASTPRLSTSPKNTPPVPRVPPAFLPEATERTEPKTPNPPADSGPADVDSLAAGVRKLHIKLKVPSPEENAAREKERERRAAEERKRAASKAASKTPKEPRKPAGRALPASTSNVPRPGGSGIHKPVSSVPVAFHAGEVEVKEDRSVVTPVATSPPPAMEEKPEGAANGWNPDVAAAAGMAMSPPLTPGGGSDGRPQSSLYFPPGMTLARDGLPVMMSSGRIPFATAPGMRPAEYEGEGGGGNA